MKTQFTKNVKRISLGVCLGMLSMTSFAQEHVTLSVENIQATKNTIEYDLMIVNDGTTTIKLSGCSYGVNYNPLIANGATSTETSYTLLPGTQAQGLKNLNPYSIKHTSSDKFNQLRMTMAPVKENMSPKLAKNVPYRVGRFRFTNPIAWASNSNPSFSLNEFNIPGITTTLAVGYINDTKKMISFSTALKNLSVKVVNSPILNPTATAQNGSNMAQLEAAQIDNAQSAMFENTRDVAASANASIKVYPNPTDDVIRVDLSTTESMQIHVKVMDAKGHIVKQIQSKSELGANSFSVSLRDVANGLYTVHVYQNDKLTLVDKVTKRN